MISEGSFDTEDLSNEDLRNSALITEINYNLQYIQIQNKFLLTPKILTDPKLLNGSE